MKIGLCICLSYNVPVKYLISFGAFLAVFYPLFVWYGRVGGSLSLDATLALNVFPAFGLLAFAVMWLHVVGGAMRDALEKHFNFQKFVDLSSIVVLVSLLFHPLLLVAGIGVRNFGLVFDYNDPKYIWLAIFAWFILVGYDVLKRFKKRDFFMRHWETIKLISTIGFFLTFFHSIGVGTDLATGALRYVWFFYGVSAGVAAIYTYGVKKFLKRR